LSTARLAKKRAFQDHAAFPVFLKLCSKRS
jgi:hypothetical protein